MTYIPWTYLRGGLHSWLYNGPAKPNNNQVYQWLMDEPSVTYLYTHSRAADGLEFWYQSTSIDDDQQPLNDWFVSVVNRPVWGITMSDQYN